MPREYENKMEHAGVVYNLLATLVAEADRHGVILRDEVNYFTGLLNYRAPTNDNGTGASWFDSQIGPITHLKASLSAVKLDVDKSIVATEVLKQILSQLDVDALRSDDSSKTKLRNLLLLASGQLQFISKLVEDLGELHTRYEQVVKYSIPDHPAPTVRGLRDSTLADRYTAELGRQVHRDLAKFIVHEDGLGSPYPYKAVPRVYLTRVYEPNSRVHLFRESATHSSWIQWQHESLFNDRPEHKQPSSHASGTVDDPQSCVDQPEHKQPISHAPGTVDDPNSFVAVRMPFWLPNSLELVPIIGHELAHSVIYDAIGSIDALDSDPEAPSPLRELLNNIARALRTAFPDDVTETFARTNAVEFLADALAVARFQGGYLYTFATLRLGSEVTFSLATDHHGVNAIPDVLIGMQSRAQKRATVSSLALSDQLTQIDLRRSHELASDNARLYHAVSLARLGVVAKLAMLCRPNYPNSATDTAIEELAKAVEGALDLLSYEDTNAPSSRIAPRARQAFEKEVINVFQIPLTSSKKKSFVSIVDKYWLNCGEPGQLGPKFGDGHFAPTIFPKGAEYFLWRQRISTSLIAPLNQALESKQISVTSGLHLHDVVWRLRWREATPMQKPPGALPQPPALPSLVQRREIRILIDDYLFRNGNPQPLFDLIAMRARASTPTPTDPVYFSKAFDHAKDYKTSTLDRERHFFRVYLPAVRMANYFRTKDTNPAHLYDLKPFAQWQKELLLGNVDQDFQLEKDLAEYRFAKEQYVLSFWLARAGNVENALATLPNPKPGITTALLLGRYDAATLEAAVNVTGVDVAKKNNIALVQRRTLSPIWLSGPYENGAPPAPLGNAFAMTLLALSSPLAWRVFLHWIKHSEKASRLRSAGIAHELYLSDGWEQAILIFTLDPRHTGSRVVDDILEMMCEVSGHPLVGRTETLFTKKMFDLKPGTRYDVSYRFRCRSRPGTKLDDKALLQALCNQWTADLPLPIVRVVTGLTDYEIRITKPAGQRTANHDANKLLSAKELHTRLNNDCQLLVDRLITQIAFTAR